MTKVLSKQRRQTGELSRISKITTAAAIVAAAVSAQPGPLRRWLRGSSDGRHGEEGALRRDHDDGNAGPVSFRSRPSGKINVRSGSGGRKRGGPKQEAIMPGKLDPIQAAHLVLNTIDAWLKA